MKNDWLDFLEAKNSDSLQHYGILGMKWGVRRYQPYSSKPRKSGKKGKEIGEAKKAISYEDKRLFKEKQDYLNEKKLIKNQGLSQQEKAERREMAKKIVIASAATIGVGAGLYLAYKHGVVNEMAKFGNELDVETAAQIMENGLKTDVLPRGTEIHRMVSSSGIDFSKVTSPTYAAYKKKDVLTYMTQLRDWNNTGERYDATLLAIKDIKMPDKASARKLFDELYNNNPHYKQELRKTLEESYIDLLKESLPKEGFFESETERFKYIKSRAKEAADGDLSTPEKTFLSGMYTIVRQKKDSAMLIDMYKQKGYDAIKDYFDAESFTDSPIILFDPSSSVVKLGEKKVTESMKRLAQKKLLKM